MTATVTDVGRRLRELIAALDRRVRRVERPGEAAIARDAAVLRQKAVTRLAEIAVPSSSDETINDPSKTLPGSTDVEGQ